MAGNSKKGPTGSIIELVSIVAIALGLALGIQAFLVKPFRDQLTRAFREK